MLPVAIERAMAEIRCVRERDYYAKHHVYAPKPTDKDLGFPLQTLTVQWDTGFIMIELSALAKLPAAQRNKIYKLGGL